MLLLLCPWMATASPVKLIIDTDFDSDVDDVAAPTFAHAYMIAKEAKIFGVVVVGWNETSAGAVHAQYASYGRPEIPVGIRRGNCPPSSSTYTGMICEKFRAAFGRDADFKETKSGHSHVFGNGTIEWQAGPTDPNRSYVADLTEGRDGAEVAAVYDGLILAAERKRLEERR